MGDQKSSGNAKGAQTPQFPSKTVFPRRGINAGSYTSGNATGILSRDPDLAIVDPVGLGSKLKSFFEAIKVK